MKQPNSTVLSKRTAVMHSAGELPVELLDRLSQNPFSVLLESLDRPVKIGHGGVIVQARISAGSDEIRVAVKQYRPQNWWKSLCGLFRPTRAFRGWRMGRLLRAKGVATPQPLLACREIGWSEGGRSYLATRWIEAAENLHAYGWRLLARPASKRFRSAVRCAESLGSLIGRMHAAGVAHRDLKAANLLVVEYGEDMDGLENPSYTGGISTWLVDLDGATIPLRLSDARRAANLARLAASLEAHPWVSSTICCRFLRAYIAAFPPGRADWKWLWRRVEARRRRIVRRKHRRGQTVL